MLTLCAYSFYEWRSPDRTFFSLAILTLCWLLVTMTPLWLLVKTGQFGAGLMFFGAFPITSRMPQYRIVLSPLTWLFWKIPTDGESIAPISKSDYIALLIRSLGAEWAIARLQVEARHSKEAMSQRGPERYPYDTEVPHRAGEESAESAIDIGKYHCTSGNHYGALCISSQGVRYVTAVRSTMLWELRYDEMKTMQKQGSTSGLAFQLMDDREVEVKGLKIRDEVFTQIIGYSGLAWQVTR